MTYRRAQTLFLFLKNQSIWLIKTIPLFQLWVHYINVKTCLLKRKILLTLLYFNLEIFTRKNTRSVKSLTYITLSLFFLLTITFTSLKLFKTFFFCFHILVEKLVCINSPRQEYENKRNERSNALVFGNSLYTKEYC